MANLQTTLVPKHLLAHGGKGGTCTGLTSEKQRLHSMVASINITSKFRTAAISKAVRREGGESYARKDFKSWSGWPRCCSADPS